MATSQESAANPYAAPLASVEDPAFENEREDGFTLNIFSPAGRIGRIRFLVYGMGFTLLFYLAIGIAAAVVGVSGLLGGAAVLIAYVGFLYFQVMLTIKRAHDFDKSGWLSLL